MRKLSKWMAAMILTIAMMMALPMLVSAASYYVTTARVNMRSGAGTEYRIVMELPQEAAVKVTSTSNSKWYKVVYQNNSQRKFTGYIAKQYLKKAEYYKTSAKVNMRSGAGNYSVVTTLPKNAKLIVVNTYTGAWYKSVYFSPSGKVYRGYVYQNYLRKNGATTGKYKTTESVYMHTAPSMESGSVTVVPKGKTVTVTKMNWGKWYKCTYKASSGKKYTGYISNVCLKKK